jgi:phosphoserine aminotransferase
MSTTTHAIHNFSAGPCILPPSVLRQASEAVNDLDGSGLSLIEISHRSKPFVAIMEEARQLVRTELALPDHYEVLFLQGGASLGFLTAAMNFLPESGSMDYTVTGTWAKKALKEAQRVGQAKALTSSEETGFDRVPPLPGHTDADFVHITTNNTIFGTQYPGDPQVDAPLIADMSSDIFSRPVDVTKYACIYAGAQKNMGPAGTVLYIYDRTIIGHTGRDIPSYLDLAVHADKDSMFNTPPVFAIYTSMLTLRWLKENGGVNAARERNAAKAACIYGEIDRNPLFNGFAQVDSRSVMNATFTPSDEAHTAPFLAACEAAGINGLKGHRSIGGFRASMYNALPLSSVETLVEVMRDFERTHG